MPWNIRKFFSSFGNFWPTPPQLYMLATALDRYTILIEAYARDFNSFAVLGKASILMKRSNYYITLFKKVVYMRFANYLWLLFTLNISRIDSGTALLCTLCIKLAFLLLKWNFKDFQFSSVSTSIDVTSYVLPCMQWSHVWLDFVAFAVCLKDNLRNCPKPHSSNRNAIIQLHYILLTT
jgi:hypothetical protein